MNDRELDRLIAAASPVSDPRIETLDLHAAEAELMEDIVAIDIKQAAREQDGRVAGQRQHKRRQRRVMAALSAVAAVSLIAAGLLTTGGSATKVAPAAVAVAEANPRVLVDSSDWPVVRADEFTVDEGEMTFGNGTHRLDVSWHPASGYEEAVDKRDAEGMPRKEVTVLGRKGVMFRYPETTAYDTFVRPDGDHFVEIRGDLGAEEPYVALLEKLVQVDVETWLAAMPPSVVKPDARAEAVDEMLRDIPRPDGFDVEKLRSGERLKDRYQLGAMVTGAVACGWLDQWNAAKRSGDGSKLNEAVVAMRTARDWRTLHEMNDEGDYPEVLWEIADAMQGGTISTGKGKLPMTDREQYAAALGCDWL